MHSEEFYAVALSRVPTVGAKIYRQLLTHFGSAEVACRASAVELMAVPGIGHRTAAYFATGTHLREAESILSHAGTHAVEILYAGSDRYPPALRGFEQAPPVLYHRGETDLSNPRAIAVVGTRRMSEQGGRQVERLLDPLTPYQPLIVSGLAYGVDVAAHRCALRIGLPTLAVLGSGLDQVYPQSHQGVAHRMAGQGGGLLTEYPPWQSPEREHFPARNRIVAMLAQLILVVESDLSGGSIITANMGHDLGRKIGACPGRGGDPRTAGCNALIKAGKAHLVDNAADIISLLGWRDPPAHERQMQLFETLSVEERAVVGKLDGDAGATIDDLNRQLQLPPGQLAGLLLGLEMREVIMALPGYRYRLRAG
ncbi:DNA processing protein [Lewinella marina]|uniref:DNA-protecting protein DprA n=1 Tax=Neolewinella marina TaxID=438751 RepID=A0A2G0CE16_9BACT|nr:DNA-processing protein DprA [Neolewinella marina]NJB87481.1 DNA processing protein [Neolewinella marina]PHK98212.1 DNA-protecting protein DprA [Neolewinella marina]